MTVPDRVLAPGDATTGTEAAQHASTGVAGATATPAPPRPAPRARGGVTRPAVDPETISDRYRRVTLAVVLVGTLLVILDTTIVNVALPQIREALHAGEGIEWIVTAYLLAVASSQPATGWLADRYGRKKVFLAALVVFTSASLCAALSPNLAVLVGFRVVQGLGGGALVPISMAMILEIYPNHRRGRAMAAWSVATMAGPAIGPPLGGYLVTAVSWHWLFLVNVPIGIVAVTLGSRLLVDLGYRHDHRLDVAGLALGGAGLALALLGASEGNRWGWRSGTTLGTAGLGIALLVAFVWHELHTREPMLDLRIFRAHTFTISTIVVFFVSAAQYTRLIFVPLEYETLRGYSALAVGLMLTPSAIAAAIGMPLGGRLVDKVSVRSTVVAGALIMCGAATVLGTETLETAVIVTIGALAVQGFGMGLASVPSTVAAMNSLTPELVAQGSAIRSLNAQIAGASAVAILSALVGARMGANPSPAHAQAAYDTAFLAAAAGLAVATVVATRLPRRPQLRPDAALLAGD